MKNDSQLTQITKHIFDIDIKFINIYFTYSIFFE